MSTVLRRILIGVVVLLAAAIFLLSIEARTDTWVPTQTSASFSDPPTGAVLIDLEDQASDADRTRVARLLERAIAPHRWPAGNIGDSLSDPAQLYRLTPPESEIDDVLHLLAEEEAIEGVERERFWVPPRGRG